MSKKSVILGLSMAIALGLCMGLAGCGEKAPYAGLKYDEYIKVGQYKGLPVEKITVNVTGEDVQKKIDEALQAAGEKKDLNKKDKIGDGDTVNIDYVGKIDGKEFEGGSAKGTDLEIGSDTFIAGFEDGLKGKHVGEKATLNLTFPKDYQKEDLAGRDVTFDVTINSATRMEKPEYTDAFIKKNTRYKTKEEYEKSLKESIRKEKQAEAENEQKSELWSQVMAGTKMLKYPKEERKAYEENFSAQVDVMAEQYGSERSEIIAQYFGAEDEKAFNKMIKESVQTLIKQEMAIEYIADKENLKYSDEEKEKKIEEITAQGYDEESVKSYTGRTMDQYAHINLLYEEVMDFILDNAKVKK
ncbi:MAG: trigger factor [Bacillota bacterium]|nr:trigger factor [Bacillota bacterium]